MIGVAGPSPYMWYHSWDGGPACFDKAGRVSPGEQAGKQHSSMASTPVSASKFLSWLSSGIDLYAIRRNKPFLPHVAFGHGVY